MSTPRTHAQRVAARLYDQAVAELAGAAQPRPVPLDPAAGPAGGWKADMKDGSVLTIRPGGGPPPARPAAAADYPRVSYQQVTPGAWTVRVQRVPGGRKLPIGVARLYGPPPEGGYWKGRGAWDTATWGPPRATRAQAGQDVFKAWSEPPPEGAPQPAP